MALRSNSSTATCILPVLNQSRPVKATPAASHTFEVPWEDQSEDNADLSYHKSVNQVFWKGNIRYDLWTVTIKKEGKTVHEEKVEATLLNFDEERWPELVKKAGLKITEVKELENFGVFYYMQKLE